MKLKIAGTGSRIGYTVLSETDSEYLRDNVNVSDDTELQDFCEDESIWDEIHFYHTVNGPHLETAAISVESSLIPFREVKIDSMEVPKLTNISGDSEILSLIKDYKGIWFVGDMSFLDFVDVNKISFETTIFHDLELITKVLYNGKEIPNELKEFDLPLYNTYVNIEL